MLAQYSVHGKPSINHSCFVRGLTQEGARSLRQTRAGPGRHAGPLLPSLSRVMWKMKILSCVNLGAKLKNSVSAQGPPPPARAVSLTLGTGRRIPHGVGLSPPGHSPQPSDGLDPGSGPLFWETAPCFLHDPDHHRGVAPARATVTHGENRKQAPKSTPGLLPRPQASPSSLSRDTWQDHRKNLLGNM